MKRTQILFPVTNATLAVDVAETAAERTKGLSGRWTLGANEGMFFPYPERGHHVLWMRGTPLSLDMLFLDSGRVVGILRRVQPLTEELRQVFHPSTAVIEAPAGWAHAHGVQVGHTAVVAPMAG